MKTTTPIKLDDSLIRRFWNNVKKGKGCWEWKGGIGAAGYGKTSLTTSRKTVTAHRVSYTIHFKDPGNLLVCHKCDNRRCVNPDHLFLGTYKDNTVDCIEKGRWKPPKGECHPNSKLKTEQVIKIISLLKNGFKKKRIAEIFNVSYYAIFDIAHKRRWKHISEKE